MLFGEIINIYTENPRKPINILYGQSVELTVTTGGIYNCQRVESVERFEK
jgi:hypothetical protein